MMKKIFALIPCIAIIAVNTFAAKWQVGPTRTYTVPSAVSTLVQNGDTVEIDAGLYTGDCVAWTQSNLVLRGVGGMAHLEANGNYVWGKGIWVAAGNNTTVEYIEFSGATCPSNNGAGIRLDGTGLTVRHCYFHNNENGILGGAAGNILIEYSEFSYNGYGDGYTHNIYINHADSVTVQYCYLHHAVIGHELKSRAHKNYILYNRIMNEANGTASYELDLPNGGLAVIIGNLIQQGPSTSNGTMLNYGEEGLSNNAPHDIYIVNNTFVDERGYNGFFVKIAAGTNKLKMYNNIFAGGPGTVLTGSATTLDTLTNWRVADKNSAGFVSVSTYDYNITGSSGAVNMGSLPGYAGNVSLAPVKEYLHPTNWSARPQVGALDIGAYEFFVLGINEASEERIVLFPNPAGNHLMIGLRNRAGNGPFSYSIYDMFGQLFSQGFFAADQQYIDVSRLAPGFYVIRMDDDKNTVARRFVKE
jgi:hypothetical protein